MKDIQQQQEKKTISNKADFLYPKHANILIFQVKISSFVKQREEYTHFRLCKNIAYITLNLMANAILTFGYVYEFMNI